MSRRYIRHKGGIVAFAGGMGQQNANTSKLAQDEVDLTGPVKSLSQARSFRTTIVGF